jgi:hypothetical protein
MPGRGKPLTIPAPTGGWNARDGLGDMPPTDAVILKNWFPRATDVIQRFGYTRFSTGLGSQVETIMSYNSGTSNKLFGIAGGNIYDCTSGGAVGAAAVTGLTNSRWQYVNNTTSGGSYIQLVNGSDKMRVFDGTTWHKDGDGAPYDITVANSANLIHCNIHKFRVWFVEKNTLKAWYLATGAIGGAATAFDLSGTAQLGGSLQAMYTWTIDAGYGVDDLAVFITSRGEIIVYKGTDPSSSTTWSLVGIWRIGTPIGRRCAMKFSGDLLIICQDGVYPLSGALQSSRTNPKVAITDKIQQAVSVAISNYGSNFGWQLCQFPKENMLFLNVPISEGSSQQQYVMNTINKSWCNFTGWNANCLELFLDDVYFGGNGFVGKAWNTLSDNGSNIMTDGLQAFNYFNSPGVLKRFTMMQPFLQTDGNPATLGSLNIDFDVSENTALLAFTPTTYATWDSAKWDSGIWGSGFNPNRLWQGVNGVGNAAAPRLQTASQGVQVQWVSTTVVSEDGGIL